MLKGFFGGSKNNEKTSASRKNSGTVPAAGSSSANPAKTGDKVMAKPQQSAASTNSVLRSSKESQAGEAQAKKAAASANANANANATRATVGIDRASSVSEEAAVLFASGESKRAIDTLIKNLNDTKGMVEKPAWYMLLDAYQATDQQAPFEKLALFFASRFGTSPPSWEAFDHHEKNERQTLGRNALTIEGSPSVLQNEKIKDFVQAAKETKSCRIDLSRMKIEDDDAHLQEGLMRVTQTMASVRKHRLEKLLMGDAHVVDKLVLRVEKTKASSPPMATDRAFWLMLFEVLQWRADEARFEELALDYAMTFEESPPGYEIDRTTSSPNPETLLLASMLNEKGHVVPDNVVDGQNVGHLQHAIDECLKKSGSVIVDFQRVRRMDFYAAGGLASFLGELGVEKNRVVVQGATELVVALCDITGASGFITFQPRKR